MPDPWKDTQARARLAGFLYLAVNAVYITSLIAGEKGPEGIRRAALALETSAVAGTIFLAWSLYALVKPAGQDLALLALLFRVGEAAVFGVVATFGVVLGGDAASQSHLTEAGVALAKSARTASGQVGQVYFCFGSAIFFYLLLKGRFLPRAVAGFGLVASIVWLASGLMNIGAPQFDKYVAWTGPMFLLAEIVTGAWLLVAGAGKQPALSVLTHRLGITPE